MLFFLVSVQRHKKLKKKTSNKAVIPSFGRAEMDSFCTLLVDLTLKGDLAKAFYM